VIHDLVGIRCVKEVNLNHAMEQPAEQTADVRISWWEIPWISPIHLIIVPSTHGGKPISCQTNDRCHRIVFLPSTVPRRCKHREYAPQCEKDEKAGS
jgi:hypothetical protein